MSDKLYTWTSEDISGLFDDLGLLNDAQALTKDRDGIAAFNIAAKDYDLIRKAIILLILQKRLDAEEFAHAVDQARAL